MSLSRERRADILWLLAALGILVAGAVGFQVLGALKEPVAAADIERVVPLVESTALVPHEAPVPVRGEGFVQPARELSLAAEMSGRVIELHPALLARGTVRKGEVLVRLDERSARATLTRAESDIESTRARLELNATQLARSETLRSRGVISQDELDQRVAQEAELSATLASLESARRSARIALDNARIVAPFAARVRSREVELGSVVAPGQTLATLFTADELEVTVPLTERAAALVPGLFEGGEAPASVVTTFAGREFERDARVTRVASALGAGTRMLDVTVGLVPGRVLVLDEDAERVADGPSDAVPPAGSPPALVNSYARVFIDGATLDALYAIPSGAVRSGDTVWLVVGERLTVHPAETVHVDGATSYVRLLDLPPKATLVTGVVDTPVEGMAVRERPAEEGAGAPFGATSAESLESDESDESAGNGDGAERIEPPRAAALERAEPPE